ncbi:dGTP triphosphohydrolase [Candidatus Deianiraea vastatrix]|uniref:Deoxyguanosinetriphosphate triphosphohydrolase-like protein n=1 Tax=Candidatus Deianiraea vastatrix TaxID=2163644 RepID=A0A5B8XDE7_9RICK|nr:dNTP triphosphohydrolase [Candidatus Deianiraea vastatrix]QED23348.1 Deoxyguanosinetriphosphate triphosphohydrolase [Candidatus Deianiraea vastatrix]
MSFLKFDGNKKRLFDEDISSNEAFCEDRMRVISSNAFKRLEAKTQVFPSYHGDHYRKRLTHSLEVAEIAKRIASNLNVDADLAEVVALSHDLGHPPFGHVGEDVLDNLMQNFGRDYKHNTFSFKIVTKLENISHNYAGLNLSWAVLDGILKHNGPLLKPCEYIIDYNKNLLDGLKIDLSCHSSLEAQIAAISDDIAYNNHDIEDGIRADILTLDDVFKLPVFGDFMLEVRDKYSFLEYGIMAKDAKSKSIAAMKKDVIEQTLKNIDKYSIKSYSDAFTCGVQIVDFSPEMSENIAKIRKFLYANLYHNKKVAKSRSKAKSVITKIFETIDKKPDLMPTLWHSEYSKEQNDGAKAGIICDYIAGMTDTFAVDLSKKFTSKKSII